MDTLANGEAEINLNGCYLTGADGTGISEMLPIAQIFLTLHM